MNQNRDEWIDALKGWGMVLIVVGHVWSLTDMSPMYQWIYAFHVPLFFFAAGLTFKTRPDSTWFLLRYRAPALLIPYFVFGLLGYVFYVAGYVIAHEFGLRISQFDYGLIRPLLGIMYGSVGDGLLVNSPLWFIPALLICTALVHTINRHVSNVYGRYAISFLAFALGVWLGEWVKMPWSLGPALTAVLFMQLGIDLKKYLSISNEKPLLTLFLIFFIISLFAGQVNGGALQSVPQLNNPMWFLFFAFIGIGLSLVWVLLPLGQPSWICMIGRNSLSIMVLHMLVIKSVKVGLSLMTAQNMQSLETNIWWGLLVIILSALLLWPLVMSVNRWLPWVLGRK